MNKISVSPSQLNQWRLHIDGAMNGYITKERLIESMTKRTPPGKAARRGTAYHSILEFGHKQFEFQDKGKLKYRVFVDTEPWIFTRKQIEPAIKVRALLNGANYECKSKAKFKVLGYECVSYKRIDAIHGLMLHEFKTTSRKPSIDDYYKSLQWRSYLFDLQDAHNITYHIFHFDPKGSVTLHQATFGREEQNKSIILNYMEGFIKFCQRENLMHLIQPYWLYK